MPAFAVKEILQATGGTLLVSNSAIRRLRDVSTDSRQCRPGVCFIALVGDTFDGHAFVREACRRGARGIVINYAARHEVLKALRRVVPPQSGGKGPVVFGVDDTLRAFQDLASFHRSKWAAPLIAITGSNGKTTTKEMTACVLAQRWRVLKTEANRNNRIGVPQTLLRLNRRYEMAVVEMGVDQQRQTARLCEVARPTAGVITNIGQDHLAFFGSLEASAEAKAELLTELPTEGLVALNADDAFYAKLKKRAVCRVVSYGLSVRADVRADRLSMNRGRLTFQLHLPSTRRSRTATLAATGRYNVANALAAAAIGYGMGLSPSEIIEGLARFKPVAMRSQIRWIDGVMVLYDCYNANPDSMKAALDLLAELGEHRRTIAVLGEMRELGPEEKSFHRAIGEYLAAKSITCLVACGPLGAEYQRGARAAGMPMSAMYVAREVTDAAAYVRTLMRPGDALLLKGSRGMQMERVLDLLARRSTNTAGKLST